MFKPKCIVHSFKFSPFLVEIYYKLFREKKKITKELRLIKGKKMYDFVFKRDTYNKANIQL